MFMKSIRTYVLCLIMAVVLVGPSEAAGPAPGMSTPLMTMNQQPPQTVTLSMFRGKVVLVDFWASWCVPCRASFPFYQNLYNKFASGGLIIVAVNGEDDVNAAQKFLQTYKPTFMVVRDEGNALAKEFEPPKMPTSYLIDRSGNIVYVHPAFVSGDESAIEAKVRAALGGK